MHNIQPFAPSGQTAAVITGAREHSLFKMRSLHLTATAKESMQ